PLEPKFWEAFCTAVGRPDWIARQFEPLPQKTLIAELAEMFAGAPREHWDALLLPADCCYEPAWTCAEVPEHPQVHARGLIHRRDGMTEVLFPTIVDGAQPPPPTDPVDAQAADVLAAWGAAAS
ncbi:MAG: CoA transferase, partial [Caulobacteraceae bacterium]